MTLINYDDESNLVMATTHKGDLVIFDLKTNPSTGYGWVQDVNTKPNDLVYFGSVLDTVDCSGVGTISRQKFFFLAKEREHVWLQFKYTRPWESVPGNKFFGLTIVIQ